MSSDADKNKLMFLLLLENNLSIEKAISEIGTQEEIYDYIRELNDIYQNELAIHIAEDTNEIVLHIPDEDKLYNCINIKDKHDFNDSHCRIAYLLYELINNDIYLNTMDLSDYMNVSRSTVNNDLRKAKKLLKKYNAEIIGIPNKGIKIKCSEFSKRLILIYEVFDYFPNNIYIDNKLMRLLESLAEYYGLSCFIKLLLYKATLVSIDRIKKGNTLAKVIPMYKNFEAGSRKFNDFTKELQEMYEIKISSEEIDFISFPINTRNSAYTETVDNTENEELLRQIVNQMLNSVKEKFMIHIDENDFFEKVRYHLLFLTNRLIFKIPVKDIFSDQIKIRFPLAFELAKISLNVLYELYHLTCTKVDISYLAVYFALILDERKVYHDESRSPRNVAVVTNRGRGTFELIKKQLQELFGSNSKIDLMTVSELRSKDTSKYGILFTTENIISDVHLPMIQISGIIDQGAITKKINEIEDRKVNPIDDISGLVELKVLHLDGKKGYRENVRVITDHLIQEGNASKHIYNVFEKKDCLSPMIYENGVAFPHLTDRVIDKLNITLGILKPETENLKIIIFLLIPENIDDRQEDTLMKIYDQIFYIISDENLICKLKSVSSVNDLRTFFNERKLLI